MGNLISEYLSMYMVPTTPEVFESKMLTFSVAPTDPAPKMLDAPKMELLLLESKRVELELLCPPTSPASKYL